MNHRPQVRSSLSLLFILSILASACASGGSTRPAGPGDVGQVGSGNNPIYFVSCQNFVAELTDENKRAPFLAVMQTYSSTYTNPATGQTIRYLAVEPKTTGGSYETLVFFNGTSQITPDWPVDLLVNGTSSLCDESALVFSDYPGIGGTSQPAAADFTFDNLSSNVYHLLAELNGSGALDITRVDPIGWSLGTEAALKFAALASVNSDFSSSGMTIHNLYLIATKSGGDVASTVETSPESCSSSSAAPPAQEASGGEVHYQATGNQAMCVTSILDQLVEIDTAVAWNAAADLKESLVGVMFPYVDATDTSETQAPYGSGDPGTICAVTLTNNKISAMCNLEGNTTIETSCTASSTSTCSSTLELYRANRSGSPYVDEISRDQYAAQRRLNFTFGYGQCTGVDTDSWQSTGCSFNASQEDNPLYDAALLVDGSPCFTTETGTAVSTPTVNNCSGLTGEFNAVYIFNGEEDMFIRNDHGKALCDWFNSQHSGTCTLNTYLDAGHGVLYDHSSEIYSVIVGASGGTASAR